jgi:ABC-2 type transport system permease protein
MIGKIVGTTSWNFTIFGSVGTLLMFASYFFQSMHLQLKGSRNMQQAKQFCRYSPNVYQRVMEFAYATILIFSNLFYRRLFCTSFMQLLCCRQSNRFSKQFLLPVIMPLMLSVYVGF